MNFTAWARGDEVSGRTAALGEAGGKRRLTTKSRTGGARLVMACHLLPIFIRKMGKGCQDPLQSVGPALVVRPSPSLLTDSRRLGWPQVGHLTHTGGRPQ